MKRLRLAGGPPGGVYQLLMEETLKCWPVECTPPDTEEGNVKVGDVDKGVELVSTSGSVENLELVRSGEVDFALVQRDVASLAEEQDFYVVDRIFYDYIHILVRRDLRLESLRELRGLRVWLGGERSGTRLTGLRLLDNVGVAHFERPPASPWWPDRDPPLEQVPELFEQRQLDAALLVAAAGDPRICRDLGATKAAYELLPLDYKTRRLFARERGDQPRGLAVGSVPAGTYSRQEESVETIVIPVLLVASEAAAQPRRAEQGRQLLTALRSAWRQVVENSGSGSSPFPCQLADREFQGSSLRSFSIVKWHDPEEGLWLKLAQSIPARARFWVSLLLVLAVLGAMLLLAERWSWRRWMTRRLLQQPVFTTAGAFVVGVLFITTLTYLAEHQVNEHFSNWYESFWSITVYLFSGLEDRIPYTHLGRIVATTGLILGPAVFALLTGWFARWLIQWEEHMPNNMKEHFLVLNWNDRALRVIQELHHPVLCKEGEASTIVMLTDDDSMNARQLMEQGSGREKVFEDFYLSVGDPTVEQALLNANAPDAKTILVLADHRLGDHADERTIRSVVALRRIARQMQVDALHVVVELVNAENDTVIDEMATEFPGLLERVSGSEIRTFLLAQATLNPGIIDFFRGLLSVSEETNEVYTVAVPESECSRTFRDYAVQVLRACSEEHPLIPVGVRRCQGGRHHIFCNPKPGEPGWQLQPGDELVVLAHEPPPRAFLRELLSAQI